MTRITFLGHASFLIELGGLLFVTDPQFSDRLILFRRHRRAHPPDKPVDAILVSHSHIDHLEKRSLLSLSGSPVVFAPRYSGKVLKMWGVKDRVLVEPGKRFLFKEVEIYPFSVRHGEHRLLSFLRLDEAVGYVIGRKVLFIGDTGYFDLSYLKQMFNLTVAIIPIGGGAPYFIYRRVHMDSREALSMFDDLGARYMVPSHWGSFIVGLEHPDRPIWELRRELESRPDMQNRVRILDNGESLLLED